MSSPFVNISLNVVVSGTVAVGKSSLIKRIANGSFDSIGASSTIGVDYVTKNLVTAKNVLLRTIYTDLAGQERFRSVCSQCYRGVCAVLVVFDVSLDILIQPTEDVGYWIDQSLLHAGPSVPVLIVANKMDMVHDSDRNLKVQGITPEVVQRGYSGKVFYVSAKTGEGIEELEREIRRVEETTAVYQQAATDAARAANPPHKGGEITGDARSAQVHLVGNEPLLCVVPGPDGEPIVVKQRGLVNLDPPTVRGARDLASASSLSPFGESRRVSGVSSCSC